MDQTLLQMAKDYASNPHIDGIDRAEIQKLIDTNDEQEITERFYKDLEFGTGGLRAVLGIGRNRINKYSIRRATQAFANVIKESHSHSKKLKIAVSYDSRNYSEEFAREVASVFAGNGIKALIFDRLHPVASLSFAVRYYDCQGGVMITASHNPPKYNGYKVFWADGSQVTPPYDQKIIDAYNNLTDLGEVQRIDFEQGHKQGIIEWIGEEVDEAYHSMIYAKAINPLLCEQKGPELKLVYTPIHGTGLLPCLRALKDLGLTNVLTVKEQEEPNGNFPTVSSPNPENEEAMRMAVELMQKENADLCMGSDPDTDRLGVAILHQGKAAFLNGNQIGVLLLHYILHNLKEQKRLPQNPLVLKTIVTSSLMKSIADKFGAHIEDTLTGFKWINRRLHDLEVANKGYNFVFGTEESYGYQGSDQVRDKDGIHAVALFAEMALWYKDQGLSVIDGLDKIYQEFGFTHETLLNLVYEGREGGEKIQRIMEYFRNYTSKEMLGDPITAVSDYKLSQTRVINTQQTENIDLPKSNVLGFSFASGTKLFLRPSGTEPKIKFYLLIRDDQGSLQERKERAYQKAADFEDFLTQTATGC